MPTYTPQYPPAHSGTYVKATTYHSAWYYPYYATDPAIPLTGIGDDQNWMSSGGTVTNQRFHVDLGSAKIIRRIYYENWHNSGTNTDRGANNFTLWGSNTEASFLELAYGTDTGWTQLTISQSTFDIHISADQADPKYVIVTNTVAYRYYALKFADNHNDDTFLGIRHLELQIQDSWEIKQLSESFSIADSLVKNATKQLAESWSAVDSWVARINLSESFSIADSLVKNATKQLAESWSIADSSVKNAILRLAETLLAVDSFKRFFKNLYNKISKGLSTYTKVDKSKSDYTKKDRERGEE